MRLILCRHGVTRYNVERRVQGSLQTDLLEEGFGQARDLGRRLAGEKIDAAYSSSMKRAIQTAHEVVKHHRGLKLQHLPGLNERGFGVAEGFHWDELAKYPGILSEGTHLLDHRFKPEQGESWTEVRHRAMKAMRAILKKHPEGTVLVVAHGGTNRMLLSGILGLPIQKAFEFRQHNACINRIDVQGKKVRVEVLNDTSHIHPHHLEDARRRVMGKRQKPKARKASK